MHHALRSFFLGVKQQTQTQMPVKRPCPATVLLAVVISLGVVVLAASVLSFGTPAKKETFLACMQQIVDKRWADGGPLGGFIGQTCGIADGPATSAPLSNAMCPCPRPSGPTDPPPSRRVYIPAKVLKVPNFVAAFHSPENLKTVAVIDKAAAAT